MFWWDGFVQIREITFWRGMSVHLIIYEATRDITFSLFQRKFHKQTNKVICITIDHVEVMCSLVFTPQRIKLKTNGHYFQFGSTVVNFFSFVSLFSTNATFQCHHICTILLNKATPCFLHHSTISKGLLIQKLEHTYTIASSSWAVLFTLYVSELVEDLIYICCIDLLVIGHVMITHCTLPLTFCHVGHIWIETEGIR